MTNILIIDDEENLRKLLARVIELEGYHVLQASTIRDGLKLLSRESIQVVISDVKLPDGNGVDLAGTISKQFPTIETIVLTAYGTIQDGVAAIKNGAFDYLTKGEHQEKIIPLLSKAAEKASLKQQIKNLESRLTTKFGFGTIIGNSPALKQAIELAQKVAATDTNVLLLGETGSGKEVFAQAIHYAGNRNSKAFVAVNCSAFAKDLLESELFGHAEGAFTGATKNKKGLLEEASEGTLFLDEVGEMHLDLQAKLLRVLETGEYYRVGDSKQRKVNARFIAATNRDLEHESAQGRFRLDLYYRLSVFTITIPSLRERRQDIRKLADHFIQLFSAKTNKRISRVSSAFYDILEKHVWKGNIRELKNVIERSVILSDGELNELLLPTDFQSGDDENSMDLTNVEKKHIVKVLNHTQGNKTQAAKLLGIGLTTLYQKIKDYQLPM